MQCLSKMFSFICYVRFFKYLQSKKAVTTYQKHSSFADLSRYTYENNKSERNMTKTLPLYLIITLLSLLAFVSCSDSSTSSKSSNNSTEDSISNDDSDDNTTTTTNDSNASSSNSSCTGTESDGQGSGLPIHHLDLMLAGHQSWAPLLDAESDSDPLARATMPTVEEASYLFQSDTRLRIRFKVLSQPYPTVGEEYCYGRSTGQASDPYNYTKLRFRVKLRDVVCNQVNSEDPSKCDSYSLGSAYRYQYIEPVNVGSCSNIIELGNLRNSTQWGTVIEVDDVKSDSTCQANDTYCPAEKIVRAASCWHMKLQIVTDYTQNFK